MNKAKGRRSAKNARTGKYTKQRARTEANKKKRWIRHYKKFGPCGLPEEALWALKELVVGLREVKLPKYIKKQLFYKR